MTDKCIYFPDKICEFKTYCENYKCDHQTIPCDHEKTHIKVIESIVTCETTVEVCEDCGKILTEPKTDCT